MADLPNFNLHGYQLLETLNHNSLAGRITYKALEIKTQTPVVIKQFRFATTQDWRAYQLVEREIKALQGLEHPNIPRYLESFDSSDGICLVQEYIDAPNLSVSRSFSPEQIKDITIQLLQILSYLQNRIPTIIHRDIKPENILFDGKQVYLIDFGFARIGGGEVTALSSMVVGTMGFMPPEQILGKPLTEASDLYGLGATIICLLTGRHSNQLNELVSHDFRINYKSLMTKYSLRFDDWLERMVEPNTTQRFANAEAALKALLPLDIIRVPEIQVDKTELQITASRSNAKLMQTITLSNDIPETFLEGHWEVAPHPSDPPHTPDTHYWIRLCPKEFRGNQITCEVTVDTSKLKADRLYERELVLITNATQARCPIKLQVRTAPIVNNVAIPPYRTIAQWFLVSTALLGLLTQGWLLSFDWLSSSMAALTKNFSLVLYLVRFIISFPVVAVEIYIWGNKDLDAERKWALISLFTLLLLSFHFFPKETAIIMMIVFAIGLVIITINVLNKLVNLFNETFTKRGYEQRDTLICLLLILLSAISTGITAVIGVSTYLLVSLAATGLPLIGMLIYPILKKHRIKVQYRRQESTNLIDP